MPRASALKRPLLDDVQRGTLSYVYKGIPCLKNPFDLAVYQILLWETQPRTIVEIGSHKGGSALWFADTMGAMGLPPNVHSVDIEPPDLRCHGVTFYRGEAVDLTRVLTPDIMRSLARPLLVIEDSSHLQTTTLSVLEFFRYWLDIGEYIVVEDGIVCELGVADDFGGGPLAAIERFMASHPGEFEIDTRYCDWFGQNVTYNVDGYLRRCKPL